jgi:hypothetical protein
MKENNGNSKKQVMYLNRWVDREFFCAFVYDKHKQQKLAKTFDEFESLIGSGIWFDSIDNIPKEDAPKIRKSKNVSAISEC